MKLTTRLCAAGATLATTAALGLMPAMSASAAPAAAPPTARPAAASTPRATASSTINQVIAGVGTFAGSSRPTGVQQPERPARCHRPRHRRGHDDDGRRHPGAARPSPPRFERRNRGQLQDPNLVLGPLHLDLLGLVVDLNARSPQHHRPERSRQPARQPAVRRSPACSTATASPVWPRCSTAYSVSDRPSPRCTARA